LKNYIVETHSLISKQREEFFVPNWQSMARHLRQVIIWQLFFSPNGSIQNLVTMDMHLSFLYLLPINSLAIQDRSCKKKRKKKKEKHKGGDPTKVE
jgi:hypothetical protein